VPALEPLLPRPGKTGRRRRYDLREVVNAIRYMTRSGGGWRMLPKDFPPWQTVYWWFRRFVRLMLFRTIHDIALMLDRERVGREASPAAGCHRQPDGEGARAGCRAWLRRRQEDDSSQAPHRRRHRWERSFLSLQGFVAGRRTSSSGVSWAARDAFSAVDVDDEQ